MDNIPVSKHLDPIPVTQQQPAEKKPSRVKRFFKAVFVHNIVAKIAAVLIGIALWVLAVGLAGLL